MNQRQFFFGMVSGSAVSGLGTLGVVSGLFGPALALVGVAVCVINTVYRLVLKPQLADSSTEL